MICSVLQPRSKPRLGRGEANTGGVFVNAGAWRGHTSHSGGIHHWWALSSASCSAHPGHVMGEGSPRAFVEMQTFFFPGGHLPGDMLCKFSKCPRQTTCKSLIESTTWLHGLSQGSSLSQLCGGLKGLHSDSWKPSGPEDIAGKGTPKRCFSNPAQWGSTCSSPSDV